MDRLLTVDELADALRRKPSSIRTDASRKPGSLPPICRIPGTRRLLWRAADVESWLAKCVIVDQHTAVLEFPAPKRGRPRKASSRGNVMGTRGA